MYTRDEIMSAIDAVKHGMSALQASKLYGVPSRTLYDKVSTLLLLNKKKSFFETEYPESLKIAMLVKNVFSVQVKKMGITTSRPCKRGSNGRSACFPYAIGAGSPYVGHLSENEEPPVNNHSALLEANNFLQHALDGRGGMYSSKSPLIFNNRNRKR